MSRHRNIRNLCEEDCYDYDDDYYDDDYYEEEDDAANYQEQERLRKEQEAARQRAAAAKLAPKIKKAPAAKKSVTISLSGKSQSGTSKEDTEKERLVVSMGFSAERSKDALKKNGGDVELAINYLLTSPEVGNMTMAPPPSKTMAPPPGLARADADKLSTAGVKGTWAPPPAATKPSISLDLKNTDGKATKAPETSPKKVSSSSATERANEVVYSKKKISPEMQERLKAQKSRLSMVILGHVDAGKSTLMGQVLVQMNMIQQRTVTKYQKQAGEIGKASFALAWIMDEDESERERGVTIDIATKHIATQKHDVTILDAPGHADYVPAMITGAGVSDVGILVISSTRGEFESGFDTATANGGSKGHVGQTREHITLAKGLGVSQLIVAVNKLDAAEPAWSQHRFDEIQGRLKPFLKLNGFNLKRVQFVPISGLAGVNIKDSPSKKDPSTAGLAEWYQGKTLLEAIDSFEPAKRNIDKPFRFIVSDLYAEGKGLIVKGRVVQGLISAGDKVAVLPVGDVATVSRIDHGIVCAQSTDEFDTERIKVALAGDSCDLIITGIDIARINVGNVLSEASSALRPKIKKKMKAQILVMEELTVPIVRGSQVLLHMHCLDVPAVISNIISKVNKRDGSSIPKPRVLTGGSNATVEIKLDEKICLETYSDCRSLGRFVLRRGGDTVAIGIIEEIGH
jgi:elongation factor 1 alpha-like protein